MNKTELLKWLQAQYQQWEALLDQVGLERMDQPGVNGDWSMKDMVAHLTGWNCRLVAYLQAATRGEPVPASPWPANLKTDDEINAWIYTSNHMRPASDVLDESRRVFKDLFTVIESLPEDVRIEHIQPEYYLVWLGDTRYPAGEFFDHYHDDHEPDVRHWLGRAENHH